MTQEESDRQPQASGQFGNDESLRHVRGGSSQYDSQPYYEYYSEPTPSGEVQTGSWSEDLNHDSVQVDGTIARMNGGNSQNNVGKGQQNWSQKDQSDPPRCHRCKEVGHFIRNCPVKAPCFICGEVGHWKGTCPKRFEGGQYSQDSGQGSRPAGPGQQQGN